MGGEVSVLILTGGELVPFAARALESRCLRPFFNLH